MPVDFIGTAVGTAFNELCLLVKRVVQTIAVFRNELKKIESTLDSIVPIMRDIEEFNRQIDRKDMGKIQDLIDDGKEIVKKCLKIKKRDLFKRFWHSKELTEFDAALIREFQLSMPLLAVRNTAEILEQVRGISQVVRENFRLPPSRIGDDSSLQGGLGVSGNLVEPEAPDLVVGLEVELEDEERLDCPRKSLDDSDLFMDLSSFPKNCKIPATAIIDMWEELYKFSGERTIADLNKLVDRKPADLVVTSRDSSEDEDKCYSSHYAIKNDLLRELAILECSQGEVENKERLILDLTGNNFPDWWSEQKQPTLSAHLVSISTDGTFSTSWPNLQLPKAEALVLNFDTDETYALPEFIGKADKLKALIVTNYSLCLVELHNFHVIGSNLRRMRFENVTVPFLSMGKLHLHSLQKISFFNCKISQASTSDDAKISEAMPNLVELHIDNCDNLMSLPNDICQMKFMRKLSITNCQKLSALPDQIGQLASLEVVRLNSCNNLLQLPNSIGDLRKLISLNICNCWRLSTLPKEIGQLVNLQRMNMRRCSMLSVLPRSIKNLRKLKKVVCDKGKEDMWGFSGATIIAY